MLTQIQSATDIAFCHFGAFFALLPHYWPQKLKFGKNVKHNWTYYRFTHVYHKSSSYDVCFLRYRVQRTKFFVILDHNCPLTLLTTQKIKILKKFKKTHGDIIILHMSTINQNHMMHDSCDMEHNRQNCFKFWTIFLPFYTFLLFKTQIIKILKKRKILMEILLFYKSVPKTMIIGYTFPEIWHVTKMIVIFHFGQFFALLPPQQPKKWKLQINEKLPGDIIISHKCTKNHDHILYCSWVGTWHM